MCKRAEKKEMEKKERKPSWGQDQNSNKKDGKGVFLIRFEEYTYSVIQVFHSDTKEYPTHTEKGFQFTSGMIFLSTMVIIIASVTWFPSTVWVYGSCQTHT